MRNSSITRSSFRPALAAIAALLLAPLHLGGLALGQPITPETKQQVIERVVDRVQRQAFVAGVDFSKVKDAIAKNQKAIDDADNVNAFTQAVNRSFRDFGVSHIRLLTPKAAVARRTATGIGIGVSVRKMDDGLQIASVIDNGPAAGAGLEINDIILTVDGKLPEATDALSGEEGSKVELKVRRSSGTVEEMTITRAKFSTRKPETLTLIGSDAGVIKIPTFSTGYSNANVEKLMQDAAGLRYLIIDLRGNGGGAVTSFNHFLGLLLPANTEVGTFVSKQIAANYKEANEGDGDVTNAAAIAKWTDRRNRVRANDIPPFPGKVAVLIDRGSASASEITAAALRELKGSPLVGARTAGAVLLSQHLRVAEGFELQLPMSDYITIKGTRLEAAPTKPDIEAPAPRRGEPDKAVELALSRLHELDMAEEPILP